MTQVRDLSAKLLDGTSIEEMRCRASEPTHSFPYDI